MPKISIVVPNYNHARYLRQRMESVLAQTFQDFEIILLDDCSTDGSAAILLEYARDPRVRVEFNQVNSGSPFKQWNKGVRLAKGKYVWIAESDDYAEPRFLERLISILDSNAAIALAYCRSQCVTSDDRRLGFADQIYFDGFDPEHWCKDFCINGRMECEIRLMRYNTVPNASAVVFPKEVWERIGGADETLRLCGDWKVWAAIALEGDVAYVSEPLSYYRIHEASVTTTSDFARVHVSEWLRVTRWMLDRISPPEEVLKSVRENHAHRWVPVLLSFHVPLDVKSSILRDARAIDPHLIRRAILPALATAQRKMSRRGKRWSWRFRKRV